MSSGWFDHLDGVDFIAACTTLAGEPPPDAKPNGKDRAAEARKIVVAQFDYLDESGRLLFQVERVEYRNADGSFQMKDGKRKKTFRQRRPDPERPAAWLYNVDGVSVVPYRLPELIEAIAAEHPVLIVEGEGKADLLWSWNVPATCCVGGAGKWRVEHAQYLRGADVVILPDNNAVGRKHADIVAASLQGVASSVRVLELPDLPAKGDIVDWAKQGGTVEKLHELIARDARPWTPMKEPVASEQPAADDFGADAGGEADTDDKPEPEVDLAAVFSFLGDAPSRPAARADQEPPAELPAWSSRAANPPPAKPSSASTRPSAWQRPCRTSGTRSLSVSAQPTSPPKDGG